MNYLANVAYFYINMYFCPLIIYLNKLYIANEKMAY